MEAIRRFVKRHQMTLAMLGLVLALQSGNALAQMPWEGPLQTLTDSMSGPVATAILTLALIGLGATIAFGAGYGVLQWGLGIVFGGAIIISAVDLVGSFFGGGA